MVKFDNCTIISCDPVEYKGKVFYRVYASIDGVGVCRVRGASAPLSSGMRVSCILKAASASGGFEPLLMVENPTKKS